MSDKVILRKLHSSRVNSINEYVNDLHDRIDDLYEALIDNEIDIAVVVQRKLGNKLRSLRIENPQD